MYACFKHTWNRDLSPSHRSSWAERRGGVGGGVVSGALFVVGSHDLLRNTNNTLRCARHGGNWTRRRLIINLPSFGGRGARLGTDEPRSPSPLPIRQPKTLHGRPASTAPIYHNSPSPPTSRPPPPPPPRKGDAETVPRVRRAERHEIYLTCAPPPRPFVQHGRARVRVYVFRGLI